MSQKYKMPWWAWLASALVLIVGGLVVATYMLVDQRQIINRVQKYIQEHYELSVTFNKVSWSWNQGTALRVTDVVVQKLGRPQEQAQRLLDAQQVYINVEFVSCLSDVRVGRLTVKNVQLNALSIQKWHESYVKKGLTRDDEIKNEIVTGASYVKELEWENVTIPVFENEKIYLKKGVIQRRGVQDYDWSTSLLWQEGKPWHAQGVVHQEKNIWSGEALLERSENRLKISQWEWSTNGFKMTSVLNVSDWENLGLATWERKSIEHMFGSSLQLPKLVVEHSKGKWSVDSGDFANSKSSGRMSVQYDNAWDVDIGLKNWNMSQSGKEDQKPEERKIKEDPSTSITEDDSVLGLSIKSPMDFEWTKTLANGRWFLKVEKAQMGRWQLSNLDLRVKKQGEIVKLSSNAHVQKEQKKIADMKIQWSYDINKQEHEVFGDVNQMDSRWMDSKWIGGNVRAQIQGKGRGQSVYEWVKSGSGHLNMQVTNVSIEDGGLLYKVIGGGGLMPLTEGISCLVVNAPWEKGTIAAKQWVGINSQGGNAVGSGRLNMLDGQLDMQLELSLSPKNRQWMQIAQLETPTVHIHGSVRQPRVDIQKTLVEQGGKSILRKTLGIKAKEDQFEDACALVQANIKK